MKSESYKRTPIELKKHAILFWPRELSEKAQSESIIPKLIATQDKFISILDISDSNPEVWKVALTATKELYPNLFLKHLMVLADFGGEPLQRIKANFNSIFPRAIMKYQWKGKKYEYRFNGIPQISQLTNRALHVDGKHFHKAYELTSIMEDVVMLILHGASTQVGLIPDIIKDRCIIGSLMGEKSELEKFVKQRYIWVSRITGGATSNTMGQIAQDYVRDMLTNKLQGWKITRNGTIPGISHNAGETDISFDIVAQSPRGKWFAIEVSFQFTTNSVIERKAGQSKARARLLHNFGHKIAYVIDGAGNFSRMAALTTICKYSDCTVSVTQKEINLLADFLIKNSV